MPKHFGVVALEGFIVMWNLDGTFLDAWEIFSKILQAIYIVIFIQNIKEETQ